MITNRLQTPNPFHQQAQTASTYLDFIQNRKGRRGPRPHILFPALDEKMLRIQDIIWQTSDSKLPVLISGEDGVGKKFIAKIIHQCSPELSEKPIVYVFCSQDSAFEEDLFGSFLEKSKNGTLVLEQITNLSHKAQKKLLKIMQDTSEQSPRFIATTSVDIQKSVQSGFFLQDLYYRLYVLHLEIPPLKERPRDIEAIAQFFLEGSKRQLSQNFIEKLKSHQWSKNIQELKSIINQSLSYSKNDILEWNDVSIQEKESDKVDWISHLPLGEQLRLVETHFILETLKAHHGNRTHAAKVLGISLRTLRNKINEFTSEGFQVSPPTIGRGC